jgi:hypothetical protein
MLLQRFAVWFLASLSFACLLGAFWHWWPMRTFACIVFPPAIAMLALLAWRDRTNGFGPRRWIIEGALCGLAAAVAYDLFRVPFVLAGYPLFAVFPRFGQMLLGAAANDFGPLVQLTGWAYHFSNGAALGIMLLAMVQRPSRKALYGGGLAWALCVEALLLASPYYAFFQLKMDAGTFLWLTLAAHAVFGIALGACCSWRLVKPFPIKP